MKEKTWGGRREGAGRPKVERKRKQRVIHYFDEEWELVKRLAKAKKLSPRAYLFSLVEADAETRN